MVILKNSIRQKDFTIKKKNKNITKKTVDIFFVAIMVKSVTYPDSFSNCCSTSRVYVTILFQVLANQP